MKIYRKCCKKCFI